MTEPVLDLATVAAALQQRFADTAKIEFRGEVSLVVSPQQIVDVCLALRDDFNFELLAEQTAVDYWPAQTPRLYRWPGRVLPA
jgi:NADH-quinone oxidoreductase subunit C